jgi:hypothetical protein
MKASLVVSALALAATAVTSSASALQLNSSGVDFKAYNAWDSSKIHYYTNGVRSIATYPTYVIASVERNPSTTGHRIYIDGFHYSSAVTTSCTLNAYNYNGSPLASRAVSFTGSGYWTRTIAINASQAPTWSYFTLLCVIPPSERGAILGTAVTP